MKQAIPEIILGTHMCTVKICKWKRFLNLIQMKL